MHRYTATVVALLAAAWQWPGNPRLRRTVREALGMSP